MDVVDVEAVMVGTVDDLFVDKAQSTISAVVTIDRILGLVGRNKIVTRRKALQLHSDDLQVAVNKNQRKTSPNYIKKYYTPIPEKDKRPIIDFLASDTEIRGNST